MSNTGITNDILKKVIRMRISFADNVGNNKVIICTGFIVITNRSNNILVTNKHNLDPSLILGGETSLKLEKMEIELRKSSESTTFLGMKGETAFSQNEDCAIIYNIQIESIGKDKFRYPAIEESFLADEEFFKNSLSVLDTVSFVGYPEDWYDTRRNIPIARIANIASHPYDPFCNNHIDFENVCLVSGHSFRGNSGSLVVSHLKFPVTKSGHRGITFEEPKAIGIMSGHFKGIDNKFEHAGLSYFTRSTSILRLIEEYDL